MDDMSGRQEAIAWLWVAEGVAAMKQLGVSVLWDLLGQIGSALPDNMSNNARERIALRCLEELFGFGSDNGMSPHVPSSHNSKISFDFSESCESVLKRIIDETPKSDLRNSAPALLKWDIHPFIVHKNATMPKCALEQLKESMLDGSHPHVDVLREKSGLTFTSSDADIITVCGTNQSLNKSCSSARRTGVEEKSKNENVLLSKRDRTGSDIERHERVNASDNLHKKMKWDASYVSQSIEVHESRLPSRGRDYLQDMSESHDPGSVSEGCGVAEKQMAMEPNRVEGGHSDAVSKRHGRSSDDAIQKNQTENHSNPTSVPQDTFQDKGHQSSCVGEVKDDGELACRLIVSNVAPLWGTQHSISAEGISEHDAHIIQLLSSTSEPQQLNNAGEGNGRFPENIAGENLERVNYSDDFHIRAKSKEWDAYYVLQSIAQNQLPLCSEDSSERDVPASERLTCDSGEGQMMEEGRVLEADYIKSKRNGQSTNDATHQSQLENGCTTTSMPEDIFQDDTCQHTCGDKNKNDGGLQLELRASGFGAPAGSQPTVSTNGFSDNIATTDGPQQTSLANKQKEDYEHCSKPSTSGVASLNGTQQKSSNQQSECVSEHDSHIKAAYPALIAGSQQKSIADNSKQLKDFHIKETSNETDGFGDKIDAAMKKHAFLISQCTSSHNSSETTATNKYRSLDCDEGDQLLTCKTSNCPIVVHENWLCSLAMSFEKGNFYCPFCSYSHALTAYLEAKKKTSQLETAMNEFGHANSEDQMMGPDGRVHSQKINCTRQFEDYLLRKPDQGNQCEEHINEVDDVQFRNITYDKQYGPPSSSCTYVISRRGKVHVPAGEKEVGEQVVHGCASAGLDKFQTQIVGGDLFSVKTTQSILIDQGKAGAVTGHEVLQQHNTDEKGGDILKKKKVMSFIGTLTELATIQSRRIKIPSLVEEGEMLKKGVQKFPCNDVTIAKMPWKQILGCVSVSLYHN